MIFKISLVLILTSSSMALAQSSYQYSNPALKTSVSQTQQSQAPTIFEASSDISYSTFSFGTNTANLNLTTWTPTLLAHLSDVTLHLKTPFIWMSFPDGFSARAIGRPEIGAWIKYSQNNFSLDYGSDFRLPMISASVSGVDSSRVAGVYPGYKAKLEAQNSRAYLVQKTVVGVNATSESSVSNDPTGTYSYQTSNPPILFLSGGAGLNVSSQTRFEMTLNFANALATVREINGSPSGQDTREIPGVDLGNVKFSSSYAISRGSNISAYVAVALKDSSNHGTAGLAFDDISDFPSLGGGLGFSQSF